jgi:drug/metabolite transporter (DMT)-like permease
MSAVDSTPAPSKIPLIAAFTSVYVIWGSTYLAIWYAIESIPPWVVTSTRFYLASAIMLGLSLFKQEARLSLQEKKNAGLSGICLVVANGIVCVVEQWVPSGIAAVIIGAMPIWMMGIGFLLFKEAKPTARKFFGAIIGLTGVALIASSQKTSSSSIYAQYGAMILFVSSWIWAFGTLVQRKVKGLKSPLKYSALQMVCGAVVATLFSLVFERPWTLNLETVRASSVAALLYLVIFGSVIAFSAYSWLSRNVQPHLVSTYALVNPVIAVALGWILAGEKVGPLFALATFLVLIGLTLLMLKPSRKTVL